MYQIQKKYIMKQRNITVTIVPDKRGIKHDVTYPLKLRVKLRYSLILLRKVALTETDRLMKEVDRVRVE